MNDFSYAAHAGSNTFLLDDDGICRRILSRGKNRASTNKSTQRCLGAQYVASLDFSSETGLIERPKEGCPLLFARVDDAGRVSLVRTAPLERFEEIKSPEQDPETDEHPSFENVDPDELPPRTLRAESLPPETRRETLRENLVDTRRESPRENVRETRPISRREVAHPTGREPPRENVRDTRRDSQRELPRVPPPAPPPSPARKHEPAPPSGARPAASREPIVDSRRLAKTLIPGIPDMLQSSMKVDIDYMDPLDQTQQRPALDVRMLPPFDGEDDDNDATIVGERPPEFRKRGMLPKSPSETALPKPSPSSHTDARPDARPPSGRKSGR